MDELDNLAGSLGSFGLGGGDSASSAATSNAGGPITANTDFNFGSGTINDSPTIVPTVSTSAVASASSGAGVPPPLAANTPVYTTPVANTTTAIPATAASLLSGNKPLYIAGGLILLIGAYIVLKK